MSLPVTPLALPSDLRGQPNGAIDPSLLTPLHARGSLHHLAARAWRALVAEADRNGLPLTFVSMYRTYDQQATLFKSRYTTSPIAGRPRKWWKNQWWYHRSGAVVAVPGTSNHGIGLAIDAAFDKNPGNGLDPSDAASIASHPKFGWFRDNIGRFGFSFEVQSEPWHIRYVTGNALPAEVVAFEGQAMASLPPFDPENGLWGLYPVVPKPVTKEGDSGDVVRYLQGILAKAKQDIGKIDGSFGRRTEQGVKVVQEYFNLGVDGVVGDRTWETIDRISRL